MQREGAHFFFDRYPLPDVPNGWAPDPRRVWARDSNKENIEKPPQPIPAPGKWNSAISAEQVRFITRPSNTFSNLIV